MVIRLLLTAVLLLVGACSTPREDDIRFGLSAAPANLDPRYATDATSERINRLLYARLTDYDSESRPVPSLAHWQQLTPLHYRFTLDVSRRRFHNGQRLTSADVAATYRSILDPENASPQRGTLAMIDRIEILDEDTIDFILKRADSLFPGYLSIGILPADGIERRAPFHHHPIGSGPFRYVDWPDPGRLILERADDQQRFVFEQVHDPTMRVLKLLRGEIDLLQNDLPPELLDFLSGQRAVTVQRAPGSNFAYVGFQLQDAHTGNELVRRAIALAIDRQAIIDHVFRGAAQPASALLPPQHWAGNTALPLLSSDPAKARALLAEAGYDDRQPLHISYKTSSDPFRVRIATILQQQLARAGIEVEVQSYDWGTFFGDIKAGRFQMYSLAWVGVKSPDIFRYAFHSASLPPAGANRGRLRDAVVDHLIEEAQTAVSLEAQAGYYRALQQRLLSLLPYIPLWYEDQYFASGTDIRGYTLAADGAYDALLTTIRTE